MMNIKHRPGKENAMNVLLGIFIMLTMVNIFFTNLSIPNGLTEGKVLYFNIVASSFIVLYVIVAVAGRKLTVRLNRLDIALLAFVLFVTINYYIRFPFRNGYLISLLLAAGIFFIIKHNAAVRKVFLLTAFKGVFLLTGLVQGVYGLLQVMSIKQSFHSSFPVTGTFHNPGPFAIYMGIIFCFSVAEYLFNSSGSIPARSFRFVSIMNILIVIIVLPSTDSRTSWIATLAGLAFILSIKYKITARLSRKIQVALSVLVLSIMIAGSWFLYHYKLSSSQGRMAIWRSGIEMIADRPLTGACFYQFQYKYPAYQAPAKKYRSGTSIIPKHIIIIMVVWTIIFMQRLSTRLLKT